MTSNPVRFRVYVAAPYARAPLVRDLHEMLRRAGVMTMSAWANLAKGPEDLSRHAELDLAIQVNRISVEHSSLVVALLFAGEGGEMFVEVGHAMWEGIPILWCGERTILSCHHPLSRIMPGAIHLPRIASVCGRIARACALDIRPDRILSIIDDDEQTLLCAGANDNDHGPVQANGSQ